MKYFVCSRYCEAQKNAWKKRKTDQKRPGKAMRESVKINGVCLARLTATFSKEGTVRVWYLPHHSGHDPEKNSLAHLRLPENIKEEIIIKGSQGVPISRIIEGTPLILKSISPGYTNPCT